MRKIFVRTPHLEIRASIIAVLAIIVIIIDSNTGLLHFSRRWLLTAVYPVQWTVSLPFELAQSLSKTIHTRQQLLNDNLQLRVKLTQANSKLQRMFALEKENTQLKALLDSASNINSQHKLIAKILAVRQADNLQQFVIDKGRSNKVHAGLAVIDATGVVGQVIRANQWASTVMMITDIRSSIPVVDGRNNMRAVVNGQGDSHLLSVDNMPNTTDIKVGDTFVTSGLGLLYPKGYPVGQVVSVKANNNDNFLQIRLRPYAQLQQDQTVLLVWPEQHHVIKAAKQQLQNIVNDTMNYKQQPSGD